MCTGSSSFPRQGLPRARRKPFRSLQSHSKTKYTRQKIKTPASGACREGRARLKIITLTQDPGKRSLPGRPEDSISEDMPRRTLRPGRTRGATSFRARQDQDPGKVLAGGSLRCVPALQLIGPRVALGPFQGRVADDCAAWGTRWHSMVTRLPPWRTETHGRVLLGSTVTGI